MNAYPIISGIKNPDNNTKELLNPVGDRLAPEFETKITRGVEKIGYGHRKSKNKNDGTDTLWERSNK